MVYVVGDVCKIILTYYLLYSPKYGTTKMVDYDGVRYNFYSYHFFSLCANFHQTSLAIPMCLINIKKSIQSFALIILLVV